MSGRESLWFAVVPATLIALGCSRSAEHHRDTAAAPPAIGGANANPVDTGIAVGTPDSATTRRDTSQTAPRAP